MNDIWKQVLEEVQIEVSQGTYHSFFKNTSLKSVENNVATITTPSFMTTTMIEKRYYDLIKNILDKKTNSSNSLIFKTEEIKKEKTPTQDPGPLFTPTAQHFQRPTKIRQDYIFDTFAVSDSNQLAHTAALTVASDPGKRYNPLFFYGTVGVGKTHLMHAIANHAFEQDPQIRILYLTTEDFTNEVVESIRGQRMQQVRKKFRTADLLLLDDIQFLSGKEKVQEELFHTFNTLVDKKSQIVFSSDRPPQEIKKIEARLASRFESGLTIDIQDPELELRTAILRIKARRYNLSLSPKVESLIADRIKDARAIEGLLLRLASEVELKGIPQITEDTIRPLLGLHKTSKKVPHADEVIDTICSHFNIKVTQLKGSKRSASLVKPRHLCMFLLKEEAHLTYVEIGNVLGGRDHTTVMHGVDKVKNLVEKEATTKEEIMYIKRRLKDSYLQ